MATVDIAASSTEACLPPSATKTIRRFLGSGVGHCVKGGEAAANAGAGRDIKRQEGAAATCFSEGTGRFWAEETYLQSSTLEEPPFHPAVGGTNESPGHSVLCHMDSGGGGGKVSEAPRLLHGGGGGARDAAL